MSPPKGRFNWIDGLSPDARNAVLARGNLRSLPDGTILYRQGDITKEVFQIIFGEVRMCVLNEQGQEVLIYIYGLGDIVGDSAVIDRDPYPVTIATRGMTKLRVWSVESLRDLRTTYAEIDAALALQTSRRLRALLMVIQDLITLPVPARIASRIAALVDLVAQEDDVPLGMSQTDISSMVGTSRQSVNHVIQELRELNLIDTSYGKIVVKDRAGLRRYANENQRKP